MLTDVIGHRFINAQLIADQFAANGYLVVVPDLFHGDPVQLNRPDGFDIMKWLQGPPGHLPNRVDPVVQSVIDEMRTKMGCRKIGAVGYCFGVRTPMDWGKRFIAYSILHVMLTRPPQAKYVVRFLHSGLLDAGYVAHPSFVEADELRKIEGPLSIAAAETDSIFPAPKRHESEKILSEVGQPYQINLFSGVEHGFAVRADISKPHLKFAKENAFIQAVTWLNQYLV
ncbi:hypothetical protein ATERTT37_006356 [Aspergillus terreus]